MAYIANRDFNTDKQDFCKGQELPEAVAKAYPECVVGGIEAPKAEKPAKKAKKAKKEEVVEEKILIEDSAEVSVETEE